MGARSFWQSLRRNLTTLWKTLRNLPTSWLDLFDPKHLPPDLLSLDSQASAISIDAESFSVRVDQALDQTAVHSVPLLVTPSAVISIPEGMYAQRLDQGGNQSSFVIYGHGRSSKPRPIRVRHIGKTYQSLEQILMGWKAGEADLRAALVARGLSVPNGSCDHVPVHVSAFGDRICGCGRVRITRMDMQLCDSWNEFVALVNDRIQHVDLVQTVNISPNNVTSSFAIHADQVVQRRQPKPKPKPSEPVLDVFIKRRIKL